MLKALWHDECGAVIASELVLILTMCVIGVIVGLSEVAVAVNTELNDISNAIGAMNQSFGFSGFHACDGKMKSFVFGTRFNDTVDDCDLNQSCDIVCGVGSSGGEGGGNGGNGGHGGR